MRSAFIGLGHLGRHLAMGLVRGGFDVAVHDLDRAAASSHVAGGARFAQSPGEAAEGCDALITCLPTPQASAAVLSAALPSMPDGATWIEMSTLDEPILETLARTAGRAGVDTLACPVTGGVHKAAAGDITVLAGGPVAAFERHRPALEAMGGKVLYLGGLEQAAVTKVVTNMLAFITSSPRARR